MRLSSGFRAALIALTVAFAGAGLSSAARADGGTISFKVIKGGWVIGASGGSGTLTFHGQHYPISIGGLSYGIVFGASETFFHGSVSNIRSPSDVSGILRCRRRRCRHRRRGAGDRADQREGRRADAVGAPGRIADQRRPERIEHFGAVAGQGDRLQHD